MDINEKSSYRTTEERESYGISYSEFAYKTPPNSYYDSPIERKTLVNVSEARGSHGAYQAPFPQIFRNIYEEPKLGKKTFYDVDEAHLLRIKRPLLNIVDDVAQNAQPSVTHEETLGHEEAHNGCCRTCWLWKNVICVSRRRAPCLSQ